MRDAFRHSHANCSNPNTDLYFQIQAEKDQPQSGDIVSPSSLSKYIEAEMHTIGLEPRNLKESTPKAVSQNTDMPGGTSHHCDSRERYSPCLVEFLAGSPLDHEIADDQTDQPCLCEISDTEATRSSPKRDHATVPMPVRKSPIPRSQPHQIPSTFVSPKSRKTKSALPPMPNIAGSYTPSTDGASATTCVTNCHTLGGTKFSEKDVFRGLHVATAAACDEDIDMWIEEIMGSGVRRFLAELSAFDGLGTNALSAVAKQAAKQRRSQVRAWEKIREKKLLETGGDGSYGKGKEVLRKVEARQGKQTDKKIGLVAGDESVPFDRKM